jgi:hypothetical protein
MASPTYETPVVDEYGTLFDLTADTGLLVPGLSTAAASLSAPGGVGGVTLTGSGSGGLETTGSGAPGGVTASGVPGAGGPGGAGGAGGEVVGAGEGQLPFTGANVGPIAAVGATLVAAGAALRRAVRRD